jgi:hypothetical protein
VQTFWSGEWSSLAETISRQQLLRLVIHVPPGHGKSLIANVFYPAWVQAGALSPSPLLFATYALREYVQTCGLMSYGASLADAFGRKQARRPVELGETVSDHLLRRAVHGRRIDEASTGLEEGVHHLRAGVARDGVVARLSQPSRSSEARLRTRNSKIETRAQRIVAIPIAINARGVACC